MSYDRNSNKLGARNIASSGKSKLTDEERKKERIERKKIILKRKRIRRIKSFISFTFLISLVIAVGVAAYLFFTQSPIDKGTKYLVEGKYEEAIEEYSQGLTSIEYMARAYKGIGIAYYELENYNEAANALKFAIQKGENYEAEIYNLLAISQMNLQEYDLALENILLAIQQKNIQEELLKELRFNEVVCMEKTADWTGAKAKATSYLQSYPDDINMQNEILFLETR